MVCFHLSPVILHGRYLSIKHDFILTIKSHWQPALFNLYYILISLAEPSTALLRAGSLVMPLPKQYPWHPGFLCTRTASAFWCQLKSSLVCCNRHTCITSVVPMDHSTALRERKRCLEKGWVRKLGLKKKNPLRVWAHSLLSGLKVGHFTGHKQFTCRTTVFLANMWETEPGDSKQRQNLLQLTLKRKRLLLLYASAVTLALIQIRYERILRFLQAVQPHLRAAGAYYNHYLHISQWEQRSLFHSKTKSSRKSRMGLIEKTKMM